MSADKKPIGALTEFVKAGISKDTIAVSIPISAPVPSPADFYLNTPLYEEFEVNTDVAANTAHDIKFFADTIDAFCPACGSDSVFIPQKPSVHSWNIKWDEEDRFDFNFNCSRNYTHQLYFVVQTKNNVLVKIGQYPSLADLALYDVKKYSKVLDRSYYKELKAAIGLNAHGVGVGSFVYLRRIFESLIIKAHDLAINDAGWNDDVYSKARMDTKIQLLSHHLPSFLVENKAIYGVLSKGIHELSEDECLQYFHAVKVGIELILDEEIIIKEKKDKIAAATKSLSAVVESVKAK